MNREKFEFVLALSRILLLPLVFASVANGDGFAQSIETFDAPNATETIPAGINGDGQITGVYWDGTGAHGFVRDRDGQVVTFDPPGSNHTLPSSINSEGQITGYYGNVLSPSGTSYHGFLRERDGTIISFDGCGGTGSYQDIRPSAINSAGQITGWYVDCSGIGIHGFLRQPDGTITAIDDDPSDPNHPHFCGGQPCGASLYPQAINATGQITGAYHLHLGIDGYTYGFLRQPDGTIVRFGTADTVPQSINNEGQITGFLQGVNLARAHGFLRQADGTITQFDVENADTTFRTVPAAINAEGQITGYFINRPVFPVRGFLRENDGTVVMFDVPNSMATYDTYATAMNDAGDITGYYNTEPLGLSRHGFIRNSRDATPPVTTATPSPGPNSNGWNSTDVTVTLTSTDNEPSGTGVMQIQFALAGARTLETQTVVGTTTSVTISTEGLTTVTYFGTDKAGNVEQAKTLTVQIDKTAPVICGMPAPGCTLWPPNHELVGVTNVTAADALSGVVPGSFQVTGSSNEPFDPNNPDVVIAPNGTGGYAVQLRAERLGSGTGRTYALNATATDLAGNTATSTAVCVVPKNARP